jgi:nitrite reductase (NO-forming)
MWPLLAGLIVAAIVGCGDDSNASSDSPARSVNGEPIEIKLVDTDFKPATIVVKTAEKVTLTLVNEGSVKHNLSIPDLQISQDVAAGDTETVTFTAPTKPGQLAIICDEPGHEAAGMTGTLVVEE